jgi:hypothetical protein
MLARRVRQPAWSACMAPRLAAGLQPPHRNRWLKQREYDELKDEVRRRRSSIHHARRLAQSHLATRLLC